MTMHEEPSEAPTEKEEDQTPKRKSRHVVHNVGEESREIVLKSEGSLALEDQYKESLKPLKDLDLILKLADPHYQKGVAYRMEKINAVMQAIREKWSEERLWYNLRRSGLSDERVREYIRVANQNIAYEDNHPEKEVRQE